MGEFFDSNKLDAIRRGLSFKAVKASVGRELGVRLVVYERRVQSGKMKKSDAEGEIAAMAGVYALLKSLDNDPAGQDALMQRIRSQ